MGWATIGKSQNQLVPGKQHCTKQLFEARLEKGILEQRLFLTQGLPPLVTLCSFQISHLEEIKERNMKKQKPTPGFNGS